MPFITPGKPTLFKKIIYFTATTVLGVLLSFIAHAFIEISYLRQIQSQGRVPVFYGSCALPPALQIGLVLVGAVGGFFLGRYWWRLVYIEKFWAKK